MNTELALTVESVQRTTPSSVQLTFAPLPTALRYRAGQYLTFHVPIDGQTYPRPYSLVGSPSRSDPLSIVVKRIPDGLVSGHLFDHAAAGLQLTASGPLGRFCVQPRVGQRHVVLIGGGSGITPLYSIASELLLQEPETTISLLYCNVSPAEIILRIEIEQLVQRSAGRLRVTHVLERDADRVGACAGRLDPSCAATLIGDLAGGKPAEFYLCGPKGLMDVVHEALRELGVPGARVFEELFVRADEADSEQADSDVAGLAEACRVSLCVDGQESSVLVPAGATILEAALDAGVPIETSCRVGDCGTCKLRLLRGEVHQAEAEGLTPEEEDEGYVLTCISRPRSSDVALTDD
ncbi:MAG: ferredoxin--NADP reductase [Myxococcota bacterium]